MISKLIIIFITSGMTWTFWSASYATGLFILAGIAEIGGGWLIWQNVRGPKPWWWSVLGALALVVYGFIPTFQHLDDFGRLYAVYGGFFIGLAFVWSCYFDDFVPGKLTEVDAIILMRCHTPNDYYLFQ